MSSSQPVVTPNAINFTPDNKRCYAYSGLVTVGTSRVSLLEFNTQSEYLVSKFTPTYFTADTGENAFFEIYLNDILIYNAEVTTSTSSTPFTFINFIVPPFTKVTIKSYTASGDRNLGALISADAVGMIETEYQ